MEEIKIMEKTEWVSWDDIHELLLAAHKKNIEKGIVMKYVQLPGEEIRKKIGDEGMCWVALCGDKLVGTHSVSFFVGKSWWNKGEKVAHGCFTGLLQEYQGIGILEEMYKKFNEYIRNKGVYITEGNTAEDNRIMRKILEKRGHKTVSFYAPPSNHYNVRTVNWLNGCPFSDKYIERRFKIAKILTKMQYKKGMIERNYIFSRILGRIKMMLDIQ
jgi:GNAT superfamily N-acetyltransferase